MNQMQRYNRLVRALRAVILACLGLISVLGMSRHALAQASNLQVQAYFQSSSPNGGAILPLISTANVLDLDLQCDSFQNLEDQGSGVISVDVYAEATLSGVVQRVLLGRDVFPIQSFHCPDNSPQNIFEPISFQWREFQNFANPTFATFALAVHSSGASWRIVVEVDSQEDVYEGGQANEDDNAYVVGTFTDSQIPLPLSSKLRFGTSSSYLTATASPMSIVSNAACQSGLALNRWASAMTFDSVGTWGAANVPLVGQICVTYNGNTRTNSGYDLQAQVGTNLPGLTGGFTISGRIGNAPVIELTGYLGPGGFYPTGVTLTAPKNHAFHRDRRGYPLPRGTGTWRMDPDGDPVTNLDAIEATSQTGFWISVEGLPVTFKIVHPILDHRGLYDQDIEVTPTVTRLATDPEWFKWDKRFENVPNAEGPRTNAIRFTGGSAGKVQLRNDGLTAEISFPAGEGLTHFPAGSMTWSPRSLIIEKSTLVSQENMFSGDNQTTFTYTASTRCANCGVADLSSNLSTVTVSEQLDLSDTAFVAKATQDADPRWGPAHDVTGQAGRVFDGTGFTTNNGFFYLPGFVFYGENLLDSMLGPVLSGDGPGNTTGAEVLNKRPDWSRHPLSAGESQRGNGYRPGFTFGPEVYWGGDGQPQMGQSQGVGNASLRMAIGGKTSVWVSAGVTDATKLNLRPSGITGVFNFDASPMPPSANATIYGYPFSLDRFAFRLVENVHDPVSWIDGRVKVLGRADFGVSFVSLDLQCSGHLAGGRVNASGNLNERLKAWSAKFDIKSIGFVAVGNDGACSGNPRELSAGGGVDVRAFARSIDLTARWKPNGETNGPAVIAGNATAELDRPSKDKPNSDGSEREGFPVMLQTAKLESACEGPGSRQEICGWFTFGAKIGVPFWNAIDAVVRVSNEFVEAGPPLQAKSGPTLVVRPGFPEDNSALWASQSIDPIVTAAKAESEAAKALKAKIHWAFDLEFPVLWDFSAFDAPGFVAHPKIQVEKDLSVIDVKGAADYITPFATKASFGASADLRKLSMPGVSLSVDLTDPNSVNQVDTFLERVIPGLNADSNPVKTVLDGVQTPITSLLKTAGGGFDDLIRKELRVVLDKALEGPTQLMASALATVQAIPQQVAGQVFSVINAGIDEAISSISGDLTSGANALAIDIWNMPEKWGQLVDKLENYQTLYASAANSQGAAAVDALNAEIANLKSQLQVYAKALGDQGQAGLLNAISKVDAGLGKAIAGIDTALSTVDTIANQAVKYAETAREKLQYVIDALDPETPQNPPSSYPEEKYRISKYLTCKVTENPILIRLEGIRKPVVSLAGAIGGGALDALADLIGKPLGLAVGPIKAAAKDLRESVKKLATKVVGADNKSGLIGAAMGLLCSDVSANTPTPIVAKTRELLAKVRGWLQKIKTPIDGLLAKELVNGVQMEKIKKVILGVKPHLQILKTKLENFRTKFTPIVTKINALKAKLDRLIKYMPSPSVTFSDPELSFSPGTQSIGVGAIRDSVREIMNDLARDSLNTLGVTPPAGWPGWVDNATNPGKSFVTLLPDAIRAQVNSFLGVVQTQVGAELANLVNQLPFPKPEEIRTHIVNAIMQSPIIEQLDKFIQDAMGLLNQELVGIGSKLVQQVNELIKKAIEKFNEQLNALLSSTTGKIKNLLGFDAAKVDGYAVIGKEELQRLHLEANFSARKNDSSGKESTSTVFAAALDIVSWDANGKADACVPNPTAGAKNSPIDVTISAKRLPFSFAGQGTTIKELALGFTLDPSAGPIPAPIGINGFIEVDGKIDFKSFTLRDIAFTAGIGEFENYIGAKAAANFQGTDLTVAFLAGEMCNQDVLNKLDPAVGSFITVPAGKFTGAYVRGSASIPIVNIGCLLRAGATVDLGAWVFLNNSSVSVGGLIGGGIYGQALCIASAAGRIRLLGQYAADQFSFGGSLWVGAGIGLCSPDEWQTPADVSDDDWCLTGVAYMSASYANSDFHVESPSFSGLD